MDMSKEARAGGFMKFSLLTRHDRRARGLSSGSVSALFSRNFKTGPEGEFDRIEDPQKCVKNSRATYASSPQKSMRFPYILFLLAATAIEHNLAVLMRGKIIET